MRRVLLILLSLLLAGGAAAAWYAADKGFTKKWRQFVTSEFRKHGVEVSMRRLNLVPFRGIVAKDVRVYEARDRNRIIAVIDEVLLVINYANLVRGKTFLDALELRDANLALPIDPENRRSPRIEVRRLSGRLFLPPHQVYLSSLEAELYGIRVNASGRLINPQSFQPMPRAGAEPGKIIERIVTELRSLEYAGAPPQLELRFSGDLAQMNQVVIEATLRAEKIRRETYHLDELSVDVAYRGGVIDLKQLMARDAAGALRLAGSYDPETRESSLRLRSTLNLQGLLGSVLLLPHVEELVLYDPPELELSVEATFGETSRFHVIAHIDQQKFAYKSVMFESLLGDFSWDGERWAARDVRLVHESGEVTGDVMQTPEDFRTRLKSTVDPEVLAPLLGDDASEWFSLFERSSDDRLSQRRRRSKPFSRS